MPDIFKLLQNKKFKVLAYPLYEEWEDIGDLATYNRISRLKNEKFFWATKEIVFCKKCVESIRDLFLLCSTK